MGQIRVGTTSRADRTLLESGWYSPEAGHPGPAPTVLRAPVPAVEVDATYYALPTEQTAAAWAARTPPGFTFNVKAFSLLTQHPTRVAALPKDLREAAQQAGKDPVYLRQVDPAVAGQVWDASWPPWSHCARQASWARCCSSSPQWFPHLGGEQVNAQHLAELLGTWPGPAAQRWRDPACRP